MQVRWMKTFFIGTLKRFKCIVELKNGSVVRNDKGYVSDGSCIVLFFYC